MKETNTLQALADKQEITELIYRYCRSVDRLDIPLGHSIWHNDGVADYGEAFYKGPGKGSIDAICASHLNLLHHSHQISNIHIDLDGDRASSESYVTATLRAMNNGQLMQMGVWARYLDKWSRRNGRWGLDSRIALTDFDEIRPATSMGGGALAKRDKTDPSYAVLKNQS